jgi:hypothetical protein
MLMMDERRTRSQWRRECVDQAGRKKRVGYWIIGKRRDELELGCCGLFRFGDRKPVLPTLSLSYYPMLAGMQHNTVSGS